MGQATDLTRLVHWLVSAYLHYLQLSTVYRSLLLGLSFEHCEAAAAAPTMMVVLSLLLLPTLTWHCH